MHHTHKDSENLSISARLSQLRHRNLLADGVEAVKIFYVRVDKVLKGTFDDKYIRIGYGYILPFFTKSLPTELFNGKTLWKFNVSRVRI